MGEEGEKVRRYEVKLDQKTSPKTYTDYRPLSRGSLVRGEDRETWRLWMLVVSFVGIIIASIVTAVIS
jgi:hypothetical protein